MTFKLVSLTALLAILLTVAASPQTNSSSENLVPLKLKLPSPVFVGTPKNAPAGANLEAVSSQPPPPLLVPADVKNIAPGKKITCSDKQATADTLAKLTDGDKEGEEDSIVQLRKGLQWVQFDLGAPRQLFAIALWHAHDQPKIFRSVIVQTADDQDFTENVRTLFNNDTDNSAGLGVGPDHQYFETFQGKLIDAKGARARYLRLYSHGSTDSALNEYTEVEIYGR